MAYIKANFKITKTSSTSIFVEEVKLNSKFSSNFKFQYSDRPLKNHPVIIKYLDTLKRHLKTVDHINVELSGSDLNIYYDLSKSKFWFNKCYLLPVEDDEQLDRPYDINMDPDLFTNNFLKINSKLKAVDKVNKFISLCPDESSIMLRLEARYDFFPFFKFKNYK